jgi:hypothetical protein
MTMDANTGQCVQLACHPTCFTCSSPASSTACLSCRTGVILSTSRTCICPSGLTMDTTTGQCKSVSCHPTCVTCSTPNIDACTACRVGLSLVSGRCVCPTGLFFDPSTSSCLSCDSRCLTCSGLAPTQCLTCKPGLDLASDSRCVCPAGAVFSTPTSTTCIPCHSTCATCSGTASTQCLTCKSTSALLTSGTCSCRSPQVMLPSGQCSFAPCHFSCLTCSGASANQCLSCTPGAILTSASTCTCSSGSAMQTDGTCMLCNPLCSTCYGIGSAECWTCITNAALQGDNSCKCTPGFYFSLSSRKCEACHPSCKTCSASTANNCLSCSQPNTLLSAGKCTCLPGFVQSTAGACISCPSSCISCDSSAKCTSCKQGAILTSTGTCACATAQFLNSATGLCELCHPLCDSCFGSLVSQCTACKSTAVLRSSTCVCADGLVFSSDTCSTCASGTYFDSTSRLCVACPATANCLTCSSSTRCTSCPSHFQLAPEGRCVQPYVNNTTPFSVSLVHNQLTVGLQLPFDQPVDRSDYISSSLSASGAGSLIGMIRSDGTPACPPVCLSPVDQSSYEWGSGQIRFNVDYTDSSDSMDVSVEIRPPFLPTAWRAWNRDNRNRLLAVSDSQTSAEAGPKMLHFPAHFVIVDFPKQPVLLVATCIYGVALAALLFLICMRPCLANLSSLPPTFWLVQPVMWCQLLFVLGFSSTSFRGFLDSLLPSLARTSFAYFGTSIDFPLLSHIAHKDVANAYYAGKYTTTGDSPYLLEIMLLPVLLYFIAWLASLITRGAVKEIAVNVRLAVGCGYGVQFAFMAGLTCVSFFKAGVYIAYTTVGVAIAILLLCLLTFDLLSLRLQYSWRKSFRSLTPSTRGVLVFDTPCTVNQKNDRPTGDVSALGDISTSNTTTVPAEPISIDTIRLQSPNQHSTSSWLSSWVSSVEPSSCSPFCCSSSPSSSSWAEYYPDRRASVLSSHSTQSSSSSPSCTSSSTVYPSRLP